MENTKQKEILKKIRTLPLRKYGSAKHKKLKKNILNMTHIFRHPKYHKEMRAERKKHQAEHQAASVKQQATSSKHQATSGLENESHSQKPEPSSGSEDA
tara:strand:- start:468 stop:764 length:297 start_codon:yes stop_codon:yes gene_type:complete